MLLLVKTYEKGINRMLLNISNIAEESRANAIFNISRLESNYREVLNSLNQEINSIYIRDEIVPDDLQDMHMSIANILVEIKGLEKSIQSLARFED